MVKALSVVWLFCGLRMDEIRRLPVGCTREHWKSSDDTADTVCNLDVPVNKTGQAFTKPGPDRRRIGARMGVRTTSATG